MRFYAIVEPRGKVGKTYPMIFEPKSPLDDPFNSDYFDGVCRPPSAVEFIREAGSGACDFHSVIHMGARLVSSGFLDALRSHKCTGWSSYPTIVYDRKGRVLEGYAGLVVTGRASAVDKSRARFVEVDDPLGYKRGVWIGLDIIESSWDGSDVFLTQGPGANTGHTVFLSEKGASALTSRRLRGFSVVPVPEMERPGWEKW